MRKISIIVPCYNEEESIPLFYDAIRTVLSRIDLGDELITLRKGCI